MNNASIERHSHEVAREGELDLLARLVVRMPDKKATVLITATVREGRPPPTGDIPRLRDRCTPVAGGM